MSCNSHSTSRENRLSDLPRWSKFPRCGMPDKQFNELCTTKTMTNEDDNQDPAYAEIAGNQMEFASSLVTKLRDANIEIQEIRAFIQRRQCRDDLVGHWLSAALEDPEVCEEMKSNIREWMEEGAAIQAAFDSARIKATGTIALATPSPVQEDVPQQSKEIK